VWDIILPSEVNLPFAARTKRASRTWEHSAGDRAGRTGSTFFGDAVGWSWTEDWQEHGFLYTDQHGMLDLERLVVAWPPAVLGNMRPNCIDAAGGAQAANRSLTG
jgi:probable HAF family extracellular repeat protein